MIYLITGTPGTGKTAFFVKMLLDNKDGLFKDDDGNPRPLYYNHIDGLKKRLLNAHELSEEEIMSKPIEEIVPIGSVVAIDECDYIYPLRGPSRPVPDYIRKLKEIRHHGITLILITQSASMVDSYVRALVGKHWHVSRRALGSKYYEFQGCEMNLSPSNLHLAVSRPYRPDKRTFKLYKSASKHVKFKKSFHWAFYAFPCILAFAAYFIYSAYSKVEASKEPIKASSPSEQPFSATNVSSHSAPQSIAASEPVGTKADDYMPRLPDHPETAPIYDGVRKVSNLQQVVGCVRSGSSCNCYSDQATQIKVSNAYCNAFINDGRYDHYRTRQRSESQTVAQLEKSVEQP